MRAQTADNFLVILNGSVWRMGDNRGKLYLETMPIYHEMGDDGNWVDSFDTGDEDEWTEVDFQNCDADVIHEAEMVMAAMKLLATSLGIEM